MGRLIFGDDILPLLCHTWKERGEVRVWHEGERMCAGI